MDKSTLSNYGWIVIAVLVLSVMIALATPFGEYIKAGVESTTAGLFDTSEKAMNVVGMDAGNGSFGPKLVYSLSDGYTDGALLSYTGAEVANGSFGYTNKIPVTVGKKYSFTTTSSVGGFTVLHAYDSEGNFIKFYNIDHLEPNENIYEKEYRSIIIPEGVASITINFEKNSLGGFWVYEGEFSSDNLHSYESQISGTNNLIEKSVILFGDSIGIGLMTKYESYMLYISEANNMEFTNSASSGHRSFQIIDKLNSTDISTYDYAIVQGFVNDPPYSTPIGELTTEGITEFDTATFIGCLENAIYQYKQSGTSTKLAFVLTAKGFTANGMITKQREYYDAAISVFEKYDVPYLDLFNVKYSTYDGVHPDFEGNLEMAKLIEAWMNTL